jgi:hypothetical protein
MVYRQNSEEVKALKRPKSTTSPCLDPLGSLKRRHRTKAAPKKVL